MHVNLLLLLYLISLAKLVFLVILWPSVYFILYSNYLIVPFLRVFLFLDFSLRKKKECLVLWILSIFQKPSLGKCSHACLQVRHGGALSSRRPTWYSLLAYIWPLHHFIADSLRKGTVSCQTWCVLVLWLVTGLSMWKLLSCLVNIYQVELSQGHSEFLRITFFLTCITFPRLSSYLP